LIVFGEGAVVGEARRWAFPLEGGDKAVAGDEVKGEGEEGDEVVETVLEIFDTSSSSFSSPDGNGEGEGEGGSTASLMSTATSPSIAASMVLEEDDGTCAADDEPRAAKDEPCAAEGGPSLVDNAPCIAQTEPGATDDDVTKAEPEFCAAQEEPTITNRPNFSCPDALDMEFICETYEHAERGTLPASWQSHVCGPCEFGGVEEAED